ncbi:uncharacterized protein B0I36DRAFT_56651 [Microdochium trichocladiopsis]|uniref:Uncharacterized protein n=1 Tax=Microdochium trichocladiopsis TaxID=1682393 RepID=A0A9P8XTD6_9PEZI|nr:uncharacterized protein B0I36DRAFT_56651 [Microdochium trichocladiopsis]KAH7010860.1 hypothetical protein B0I36DRAFT_56651 [Microdochium trichocladiopsis]
MPNHAFSSLRAQAAAPPAMGLMRNRGPAAVACLNIAITVTTTIKRAAQNNVLSLQTTEERRTMKRARALPRSRMHERVWRVYPRCRTMEEMTTMSRPVPAHPCSHPPAETRPICSTLPAAVTQRLAEWPRSATSAVVDIAIPMMRRTTVLVCTATLNTARMMLSGRRGASAVG